MDKTGGDATRADLKSSDQLQHSGPIFFSSAFVLLEKLADD
jgi:hypothetical protein